MTTKVTVTNTQVPLRSGKASEFEKGEMLKCISAPSGYLYAIGFIALRAGDTWDKSFILQFDGDVFRTYGDDHVFFSEARFEAVAPGTTIPIKALL